jgi:CheY-like chemotaxis protein
MGLQIKTMNGLITQENRFNFAEGQLLKALSSYKHQGGTGYWQHHFDRLAERERKFSWYLGVHQGKLIYSSSSEISAQSLLRILLRYAPPSQRDAAKAQWRSLQQKAQKQEISEQELWQQLQQDNLVKPGQLEQAIKLKILNDLDSYMSLGSGWAEFISAPNLAEKIPCEGQEVEGILLISGHRQHLWQQIDREVPSIQLFPVLSAKGWGETKFNTSQQAKIESLIKKKVSLNQIAQHMGKDSLDIAQMFAKLVRAGAVEMHQPQSNLPTILTVDDSPVVLKQFNHWLTNLNYKCVPCQHATQAITAIKQCNPAVIFLDINMPVISGFELVKNIRSQIEFAHIPIVILTGEQKLSNKWRAQWSGCEFLTKPTSSTEYKGFQEVLQELIPKLLKNTEDSKVAL